MLYTLLHSTHFNTINTIHTVNNNRYVANKHKDKWQIDKIYLQLKAQIRANLLNISETLKNVRWSLAGVAQWIECCPAKHNLALFTKLHIHLLFNPVISLWGTYPEIVSSTYQTTYEKGYSLGIIYNSKYYKKLKYPSHRRLVG